MVFKRYVFEEKKNINFISNITKSQKKTFVDRTKNPK